MTGTGYDDGFLGVAAPRPGADAGRGLIALPSTHFEVHLDPARRLAAFTAVNIDGGSLIDIARSGDVWHLDPRAPASAQCGPDLYARNSLDRGHLVRRRDPCWGDPATAAQANADTFSYANAAPQASAFNQSKELWLGLEDYLLGAAQAADARLAVFTGPVFRDDDAVYRGVRLPRAFWKVAAWRRGDALAATGYLVDQSPLITDLEPLVEPPLLGPFRTYQVGIAELADLTGLDLAVYTAVDRYARVGVRPVPWRELAAFADIVL